MKRICFIFIMAAGLAFFASCDQKNIDVSGTWISVSIDNPAPLFKSFMPDTKKGSVSVVFTGKGSFTWTNTQEKKTIKGTYTVKGSQVTLHTGEDENPLVLKCRIKECRLILKTDDGFIFIFERKPPTQ